MTTATEALQKQFKCEVDEYKQVQKDYLQIVKQRQQLDGLLNENIAVKNELDLLKPEDDVFKLIGPVLIKQDIEEAKQNVAKRMEYITSELVEELITTLDKKLNTYREALEKYQEMFQETEMKASFSQLKA
ncbi:putative prefoldin subunit 6 [Eufriesea mexicana]|nr:putative prefoldin subunit 6 [Eufriesea mexicana]